MTKSFITFFIALYMFCSLVFAQTATADLYGKVVDENGSAISEVEVTLKGDVIDKKSKFTSADGSFRFEKLSQGNYVLEFGKDGFKPVICKNITISTGEKITLKILMEVGAQNEAIKILDEEDNHIDRKVEDISAIEITDNRPIDTRHPTISLNVTETELQSLPTARNPWTILRLIPGIILDREDVGGSESGQQSDFYGLGASDENYTFYVDAANITNPTAIGDSPIYLNTNSYEEIQVTMGANDISAQTGGIQLNFVTRRGGNKFSGDIYAYAEDESWEMKQSLPTSITSKNWGSPGINRLYQYGSNLGGPIIKDKLWFFGSYAIQDVHARTIEQTVDNNRISSKYARLDFQFGSTSGHFKYTNDTRKRKDRTILGAKSQDPSTYLDQFGPDGSMFQLNLQQEIGHLMLNANVTYLDGGFTLNPKVNKINPNTGHLEGVDCFYYIKPSKYYSGSLYYCNTIRNSLDLSLDGNIFVEKVLASDHEIRFGVDYCTANTTTQTLYPNQRILYIEDKNNPDYYKEIWWKTDSIFDVGFKRLSFYLSDTINFGKLTANIGLRYDKETGFHHAATAPRLTFEGVPIFTEYLGNLSIPAKSIDASYEVFSPRLSLIFDIKGNGENVLKASFARYGSQSGNSIASFMWPAWERVISVYWADDGDNVPEPGEWSTDPDDWWLGLYVNRDDPYSAESPNQFDPDFNSPILTEFVFSFEKALGNDVVFALNAFYKKMSNLIWDRGLFSKDGNIESPSNWDIGGTYTFNSGKTADYYLRVQQPDATYRTNYGSGTYNIYTALQLVFSKRLSHKWMLDASFTWSNWKRFLDRTETFDLSNFNYYNGGVYAPESGGSGTTGVFVNSRWQFKLSGLFQLPWGISVTGVFQAREGYVISYYEKLDHLGINIYEADKKFGDDRLPIFWVLNLGMEKTFKLKDSLTTTLFVNGYNITNNAIALNVEPELGTSATGEILRILNPGIFQFGIRLSF
jgi:hypothetical protein